MAIDLTVATALRSSNEWSVTAPANISSYAVIVPFSPSEWLVPHRLLIEAFDGSGHELGKGDNTAPAFDKATGLPEFKLKIILGIERESVFPTDWRAGRTIIIDGVRYRQKLIDSPLILRVTVDVPLTYGLTLELGTEG